jgi:hypothetical protein
MDETPFSGTAEPYHPHPERLEFSPVLQELIDDRYPG